MWLVLLLLKLKTKLSREALYYFMLVITIRLFHYTCLMMSHFVLYDSGYGIVHEMYAIFNFTHREGCITVSNTLNNLL